MEKPAKPQGNYSQYYDPLLFVGQYVVHKQYSDSLLQVVEVDDGLLLLKPLRKGVTDQFWDLCFKFRLATYLEVAS